MNRLVFLLIFSFPLHAQTLIDTISTFDTDKTKTTAVIVGTPDSITGEFYSVKGMEDKKFLLWSISKTISALVVGRAIEDGHLKLDEEVKDSITIKDLLQMSSGIDWDESYEEAPFRSNVVRMLYGPEAYNMGEYILKQKTKYKPGNRFKYSSGDSNLIQWYLKKKMGAEYNLYPWKSLFDPLGIKASFETDGQGIFVASSYVYMSAKDLFKIAQLILQKGKWNDVQVIPELFIEQMVTACESSVKRTRFRSDDLNYGFQIWLNSPSSSGKKPLPDLPGNSIFMLGHHGQLVGIFPDEKIIILRSAYDRGRIDKNKFFSEILLWAKKQPSL
jgi:CubicO group peptidase (beta-lactamase class C family)